MQITVEAEVAAPIDLVWVCWTTPEHILQWNAASDDWHTTEAQVDLRVGGTFRSRMEAKDGSMGFDFEGTYTTVRPLTLLEASFGGRQLSVAFEQDGDVVRIRETFDAEPSQPIDMQRDGWQAILDNFVRHVAQVAAA
ncbi:SRPBCC family protein [Oceanibium sediminis]|uniref:SRPBCC family protein n=1 Tax=Oceanibium sediminis TaxID=2026339 RepID=UPI000DD36725|nr:SRPBCC family protein [Oceanibium sediminis]